MKRLIFQFVCIELVYRVFIQQSMYVLLYAWCMYVHSTVDVHCVWMHGVVGWMVGLCLHDNESAFVDGIG